MYRFRFLVQVRYGHFKEHLEAWEQLNEISRSRGWAEATFWVPSPGTANEFIGEIDYPDLATYQREGEAFFSDTEAMKLFRSAMDLVIEGTGRTELLATAPTLA
jgi:hypothetical protein